MDCEYCGGSGYEIIIAPVCCACPHYDFDEQGEYINGSERCCNQPIAEQQQEMCVHCLGTGVFK